MTEGAAPNLTSVPAAMMQLGADLDLRRVLQTVTDTGTELTGAQFGAFFYNVVDEDGRTSMLNVASDAQDESSARRPPVRSRLTTPVVGRDGTAIGLLVFGHPEPDVFDARAEAIARAVAAQAAISVENARLFEREQVARRDAEEAREQLRRHVAELTETSRTLQRSLLPASLPIVDGVRTAVRYLPALAHAEVGGDWYDVIATPAGAVTVAIGDVQGHNMQAAAEMGRLRTTLRAYLAEGHSPAEALARANALTETDSDALLATCCLVTVDPASGQATVVRAGHPLPILHRADGTTVELAQHAGPPLGIGSDQHWEDEPVRLRHGDRLVLYTDGLVDVRGEEASTRHDELLAAVASVAAATTDEAIDEILRAMVRDDNEDDVAVVVCDVTPIDHLMTVSTPEQVGLARAFTADQLAAWGLADLEPVAALVVSELVTNSLRHGGGTADLVVRRLPDAVRFEVTDGDPISPRLVDPGIEAEGQRGVLLVDATTRAWGVDSGPAGKTVWAEIEIAAPPADQEPEQR